MKLRKALGVDGEGEWAAHWNGEQRAQTVFSAAARSRKQRVMLLQVNVSCLLAARLKIFCRRVLTKRGMGRMGAGRGSGGDA